MSRTITRDTELGLRLCRHCRMGRKPCKDSLRCGCDKYVVMNSDDADREKRALLTRSLKLRIMSGILSTLCHPHDAMVRSISAATHRQIRLAPAGHGQERLNKRQTQKGQQRDGE